MSLTSAHPHRRCFWGFKVFEDQVRNDTFRRWLWARLDIAIVLERRDGGPNPCTVRFAIMTVPFVCYSCGTIPVVVARPRDWLLDIVWMPMDCGEC